ncbi:hypothetical protein [Nocardiopsis aegyptia]|uniref:Lipoprotein n=1 Tax=Nocardiopsis aegyptia TaxID=220378 RepID=A0A7Z0ETS1_9ACTN|nr:hypothetical protein [Nocardiopsis aegyptia]NYJ37656.1 hypothetical protein [Nocardiopsis aegyptia]
MASTRLRASAAAAALLLATAACGWSPEEQPPTAVGPAEEDTRTPAPPDEATRSEESPGQASPDEESPAGEAPEGESPAGETPTTGPAAPERTGEPSSSASPSPTTAAPTQESASPSEHAAEYMDALAATDDPDRMREGWLLAPEGSTADAFLTHRISVVQARVDEGRPLFASEVRPTAQGFELCDPGDKDADPPQERQCAHFTGFESEGDRIETFLVDGVDPGPGLFGAGDGSAASEGVHAALVSAYHAQDLEVTVEVGTVHAVDIDLPGAVYVGPDGEEHDVASAAGRYELEPGATTRAAFRVADAEPGGVLRIGGCREECSAMVELEVPVG